MIICSAVVLCVHLAFNAMLKLTKLLAVHDFLIEVVCALFIIVKGVFILDFVDVTVRAAHGAPGGTLATIVAVIFVVRAKDVTRTRGRINRL